MATERSTPPEPQQPSFERPPKKSLTPWVLLLPAALLIGVLWQLWREPEQPVQSVMDNGLTPPKKPQTRSTQAPEVGSSIEKPPAKLTIFVPNDNAMLERQVIDNPLSEYSNTGQDHYEQVADVALNMLEKKAPDLFPPGSIIGSIKREDELVKINLKKQWYELPQWTQGSSLSVLAQDSIVNTLAALDAQSGTPIKVQFLQDGKPAQLLGELDLSEPLSPNTDSVAGS